MMVGYVLLLLVYGSRQVPVVVPNPPLSLEECQQLGDDARAANYFSGAHTSVEFICAPAMKRLP